MSLKATAESEVQPYSIELDAISTDELLQWLDTTDSENSMDKTDCEVLSTSSSDQRIVCLKRERSPSVSEVSDVSLAKSCRLSNNSDDNLEDEEIDLTPRPLPARAWRRVSLFTRIPKRDFRREFPIMLANVANCGDFEAFAQFTRSTSTRSLRMVDFKKMDGYTLIKPIRELSGVDHIVDFLVELMSSSPDFMFVLKNAQIKQHLHQGGCQLIIDVHISGTRIRDVFLEVKDEKNNLHTVPIWAYTELLIGRGVVGSLPLSEAISVVSSPVNWTNFKLDIKPEVLDLNVSITVFMDNNNRVYKMEKVYA